MNAKYLVAAAGVAFASLLFNDASPAQTLLPPPPPQSCADGSVKAALVTCPATVPVSPGRFMVFFDWDKTEITSDAAAVLDNVAAAFQQTGKAMVLLAGHADRSGSAPHNVALSQRRADAVTAYLVGKGVTAKMIATQSLGESQPLVATADGVREPQNRSVQIVLGPGSGQ